MTIHDTVACEQQIKKLVYRTNNVIPDTTLKNKHENSIQQTLV